jgi:TrpR-related protein YerC/YecD
MRWNTPTTEDLFRAILGLANLDEAKRFFRDLLTEEEIVEFSKRWQAAQMLADRVPYSRIVKKTGLSSRTVARISVWLRKGLDGYGLAIRRKAGQRGAKISVK